MSVAAAFFRIIAALILSLPVFFGFSYYLGASAIEDTLLKPSTLVESLEKNDAYNRIYEEFLLKPEFSGWTNILTGGFQLSDEDRAQALREVIPPAFIQAETERNIGSIVGYLNGEVDDLQVFIDIRQHVGRIEPAVLGLIDRKLDAMEERSVSTPEELAEEFRVFLLTISIGQIPAAIPAPVGITPSEASRAYQQALDMLAQSAAVSPEVLASLQSSEADILAAIRNSDTKTALKIASRAAAEPVIDEALAEMRGLLDEQGRFDLVEWIGGLSNLSRSEVVSDADLVRRGVSIGVADGAIAALVVMAVGTAALALVFFPHWRHVVFWPGVVLLLAGLLFLAIGWWLTLNIPGLGAEVCGANTDITCSLSVDVARSIASEVGSKFITPSLIVLGIGAFGVLLSIFLGASNGRRPAAGNAGHVEGQTSEESGF